MCLRSKLTHVYAYSDTVKTFKTTFPGFETTISLSAVPGAEHRGAEPWVTDAVDASIS